MFDELGDHFGIRFRLECETLFEQKLFDVFVIGDDTVVHDDKLVRLVRTVRVAVERRRCAVRRPTRVRDADMCRKRVIQIGARLPNLFLERFHLSLSADDLRSIAERRIVDGDARRVVAAILKSLQATDEKVKYLASTLGLEIVEIRENSYSNTSVVINRTGSRLKSKINSPHMFVSMGIQCFWKIIGENFKNYAEDFGMYLWQWRRRWCSCSSKNKYRKREREIASGSSCSTTLECEFIFTLSN